MQRVLNKGREATADGSVDGGRTLSTLALVLADVSTYWTPHSSAFPRASSTETCLRSSKSDLFPTTSSGILSSSAFTRRICSLPTQQWRPEGLWRPSTVIPSPPSYSIQPWFLRTWTPRWQWRTRAPWWRRPGETPPRCGSSCPWWQHSLPGQLCLECRSGPPPRPEPPFSCSCRPWWAHSPPQTEDDKRGAGVISADSTDPRSVWTVRADWIKGGNNQIKKLNLENSLSDGLNYNIRTSGDSLSD